MKPLHLKFCGINSFSEEAEIDFEQLTKNGLFGIFGDTGSGKSTILDAINFALYGEVERNKEKQEMINYKSQSATVEFSFRTLEGGEIVDYTVERVLKKDKSGTHKAKLFKKDEKKEECIADKPQSVRDKIVQILGVDKEDFRKCIAIPQGEFSEFVKSQPAERLKLIERLFNLNRYGEALRYKINGQLDLINREFDNLNGQLEVYKDDNLEKLNELKERLKHKAKEVETLKNTSELFTKRHGRVKELHLLWSDLKEKERRLEILNRQKEEMDGLRRDLSLLESCRQIVATCKERESVQGDLKESQTKLKTALELKTKLQERLDELKASQKSGDFDKKIMSLNSQLAKFSTIEGKPEQLQELELELKKKRDKYKAADDKKKQLISLIEKVDIDLKALDADLKATADTDINSIINIYYKNAILREEYIKELGWAVEFKQRTNRFEGNDELYEFVNKALENKIDNYKFNIENLNEYTFTLAEEKLKGLNDFNSNKESAGGRLSELSIKKAGLVADLQSVNTQLDDHMATGVEDRKRYDALKQEIEMVVGKDTTLDAARTKVNGEIEALALRKNKLEDDLEAVNKSLTDGDLKIKELQTQINLHTKELERKDLQIVNFLKEVNLTLEECAALVKKYSSYENAKDSLESYDKECYSISQAITKLKEVKDIDTMSDELLTKCFDEMEAANTCYNEESGNLKVLSEQANQLESRLKKKDGILEEFKVVEKRRNLVFQLQSLVKGNKFLEFVADEYLCDISALASKTLITLTDGRYYLVYRSSSFSVCDNYDGGNMRGVNTLSGGETFLVSLSLALALSQTICAKSLKSIEFFFLDEGFGTLDSNLIDTVMNALEKLKSSNFTIGVISHVEELKHRIDCKITVNKATETQGSSVQLSL